MQWSAARDAHLVDPVRTEIRAHIRALGRDLNALSLTEISGRAILINRLGAKYGFHPIQELAGSMADAIGRDGRGAILTAYVAAMNEAITCESFAKSASETFLASVSVRLAN